MSRPFKSKHTYPKVATFAEEVQLIVEHYLSQCKPGQGLFINFKKAPKHRQPVIDALVNNHGWVLERPFFIRNGKKIEWWEKEEEDLF